MIVSISDKNIETKSKHFTIKIFCYKVFIVFQSFQTSNENIFVVMVLTLKFYQLKYTVFHRKVLNSFL